MNRSQFWAQLCYTLGTERVNLPRTKRLLYIHWMSSFHLVQRYTFFSYYSPEPLPLSFGTFLVPFHDWIVQYSYSSGGCNCSFFMASNGTGCVPLFNQWCVCVCWWETQQWEQPKRIKLPELSERFGPISQRWREERERTLSESEHVECYGHIKKIVANKIKYLISFGIRLLCVGTHFSSISTLYA